MLIERLAIVVSGSRRLYLQAHREEIRGYLERQVADMDKELGRRPSHIVVIHGAQKGADLIADEQARELRLQTWAIPYFHELDDPQIGFYPGGPKRNECIIDLACVLRETGIYRVRMGAFPDASSKGTWRAVNYAHSKGIEAEIRKQ